MNGLTQRGRQAKRLICLIVKLSGGRGFSVRELAMHFDVATKTVRRDMRAIEDMEIPLYEEEIQTGEHFNAKTWRIDRHWMRRFQ